MWGRSGVGLGYQGPVWRSLGLLDRGLCEDKLGPSGGPGDYAFCNKTLVFYFKKARNPPLGPLLGALHVLYFVTLVPLLHYIFINHLWWPPSLRGGGLPSTSR